MTGVGIQLDARDARLMGRIVTRARKLTRANHSVADSDPDRPPCGMDRQTAGGCARHGIDLEDQVIDQIGHQQGKHQEKDGLIPLHPALAS